MNAQVAEYLTAKQTNADKDVAAEWAQLEDFYNKR